MAGLRFMIEGRSVTEKNLVPREAKVVSNSAERRRETAMQNGAASCLGRIPDADISRDPTRLRATAMSRASTQYVLLICTLPLQIAASEVIQLMSYILEPNK